MGERGMDRTAGIRHVVRNIPLPVTDLPEPGRITSQGAGNLKHLAGW